MRYVSQETALQVIARVLAHVERLKQGTSGFTRNVLKLYSGNLAASLVLYASMPVVTRLYSPADLGLFQVMASTIIVLGSVSTLKYELAIVLSRDQEDADNASAFSTFVLVAMTTIIGIGFFFGGKTTLRFLRAQDLVPYVPLILVGLLLIGFERILEHVLLRRKDYWVISRARMVRAASQSVLRVTCGTLWPNFVTLTLSHFVAVAAQIAVVAKKCVPRSVDFAPEKFKSCARKNKKLPIVNTSLVFINDLSLQLPIFMLSRYANAEFLGFYALTQRLLNRPLRELSRSIAGVYLSTASASWNRDRLGFLRTYRRIVIRLFVSTSVPAAVIALYGPQLVELAFGEDWLTAGVLLQILMISKVLQFINSGIGSTFTVIGRQEIALLLTLLSILLRFGAMYFYRESPMRMVLAMAIAAAAFYATYMLVAYVSIWRQAHSSLSATT